MPIRRVRGFTLVELLVVITIIGILIALLLPAVQAARESARLLQCQNNLKQLVLACHNYETARGGLPLLYSSSSQLGWITQVLPYFEQENIYNQYNINLPWFDAGNAAVVAKRIPVLECPSGVPPRIYTSTNSGFAGQSPNPMTTFTVASTDYFAISGASSATTVKAPSTIPAGYFYVYPNASPKTDLSGVFWSTERKSACRQLAEVTDGLSNTMMISEMSGRPWLYLANKQRVMAANFPSYVSTSSGGRREQYRLELRLGSLGPQQQFHSGNLEPRWNDARRRQRRQLQQLPRRLQLSLHRGVRGIWRRLGPRARPRDDARRLLRPGHGTRRETADFSTGVYKRQTRNRRDSCERCMNRFSRFLLLMLV